jgi:hypothetical protein
MIAVWFAELPSSAEEGWPKAGVMLARKRLLLPTPPRLRGIMWLRDFFLIAQPPLLG